MSGLIHNPAELTDALNLLTCEAKTFHDVFEQGTRVYKLTQQNVDRVLVLQHDKQIQETPQQEQPTFDPKFECLNQRFNNLNLRFDNLDNLERLKNLETRMQTFTLNSISREMNALVSSADETLSQLLEPSTGRYIPGFPATPAILGRMQDADIDAVLVALEVDTTGNLGMKISRLHIAIGLKVDIIQG